MSGQSTFQRFSFFAIAQKVRGPMMPASAMLGSFCFVLMLMGMKVEFEMQQAFCALQIFPEETGLCPEGGSDDE